ncbi:HNH endonuclease signature motif containing protein [Chryseobacterium sp. MP_3.2]|uniref:HNH endonuclease signature motif containing protein n=1 Tax=Chryseobacterium sp. MP_3.2 TaxID=3071712 RepID=UPI002DF9D854|nr:hypothetical protein [Chryseobacterium sp. MP_3.2]
MKYKFLKSEDVQEIIKDYPNTKAEVLAIKYDVPVRKIYATAKRYNCKKSPEFLMSENSGRIKKGQNLSPSTRFQKGMTPFSKGKKMENLIKNKAKIQIWKDSLWKKGNTPYNIGAAGEVRWRESLGYYFIKISDNKWLLYHKWLWENQHGQAGKGFNVIFKDKNPKNCVLDNLECISNQELMARNTIARYPSELISSIKKVSRLKNIIKKLENG